MKAGTQECGTERGTEVMWFHTGNYTQTSKVTAPQDAHRRLVLQVYLGSNTIEFSAIHR